MRSILLDKLVGH